MKLSDDFMRHFRWLTPLLLALSVYLLQDIYLDFKQLKKDVMALQIDSATTRILLTRKWNK